MNILKFLLLSCALLFMTSCGGDEDPEKEMENEEEMEMGSQQDASIMLKLDGVDYDYVSLFTGGNPLGAAQLSAQKSTLDFFIIALDTELEAGDYTEPSTFSTSIMYRRGDDAFTWQSNSGTFTITENDTENKFITGTISEATLFDLTATTTNEITLSDCKFTIPY